MSSLKFLAILAALSLADPSFACVKGRPVESSAPPLHEGTIVYQGMESDGQQYLYSYDAVHPKSDHSGNLTKRWKTLYNAQNAHFSPDGRYLVFTAITCPGVNVRTPSCVNAHSARTDAFIWRIGAANFVGLTTALPNLRYEDVIFETDGAHLVLKVKGYLASGTISFKDPEKPTLSTPARIAHHAQDGYPQSEPYPTADGKGGSTKRVQVITKL